MAAIWGLIQEEVAGGEGAHYSPQVLAEFAGTREEALEELERHVAGYVGKPTARGRRRVYRTADGFLVVRDGVFSPGGARFTVAELVSDSEEAKAQARAAKAAMSEMRRSARKQKSEARRSNAWWVLADEPDQGEDGGAPEDAAPPR